MRGAVAVVALCGLGWTACGGGDSGDDVDAGGPRDYPEQQVPASSTPEPGVRREVFVVDGATPPANPDTGETTPGELNKTQVVRYRVDEDPPAPARGILVAMPGFLGGAGEWDMLARHLVRNGAAAGTPVEVWVLDRRANLLEDLRGMDTAEASENPEIASGYYFDVDTVGGSLFAGFTSPTELGFMSEWGLATHVGDVAAVIDLVAPADQRGRVFLVGHSLGAFFAEAYAGWRFEDGSRGVEQLAGLVMLDGVLRPDPITEEEFQEGTGSGFEILAGLGSIRRGTERYFALPIFGNDLFLLAEIMAQRAVFDPGGVVADANRDDALRILMLFGNRTVPAMTNEAAIGFAFDEGSAAISINAVSCGRPAGGPLEEYESAFAPGETLLRPADPGATYTWESPALDTPGEVTAVADLARSAFAGRTNLYEWYFPSRLPLDLAAVGGAAVAEDGYQAGAGLRVFDGPLIDAPILAVSAGAFEPERYAPLPARVAPAIGPGRLHEGATRDLEVAYKLVVADGFTHVDPLTAADRPDNPIPSAILEFVNTHAASGGVQIPVQP